MNTSRSATSIGLAALLVLGCALSPLEAENLSVGPSVDANVFPPLQGNEEALFFHDRANVVDQLPMDTVADTTSQLIFIIATGLYNAGRYEDAAAKFNYFFWDAADRGQSLSQRTIDYVLMWRAYSLSRLGLPEAAHAVHEFRLQMMDEGFPFESRLPNGLSVVELLVDDEKRYVTGVIYEELSITHMNAGRQDQALQAVQASLDIFSDLGSHNKAVEASLLFMQNCMAYEAWDGMLEIWNRTWRSLGALMATPKGWNLNAHPEGYVRLHRFLLAALYNTGRTEDALVVSDAIVKFRQDAGYDDEVDDLKINRLLREQAGN